MTSFGQLTNDEKKALMCAWVDGKKIEGFLTESWVSVKNPSWGSSIVYRIKPEPVVQVFVSYGLVYPWISDPKTQFVWHNFPSHNMTHKLTITMIDGVVHTAKVEKL